MEGPSRERGLSLEKHLSPAVSWAFGAGRPDGPGVDPRCIAVTRRIFKEMAFPPSPLQQALHSGAVVEEKVKVDAGKRKPAVTLAPGSPVKMCIIPI